jgi:nucleotidyltransferase/DNA polymerase involved in DNA repair
MNRFACFWIPHFAAQVEGQRLGEETRPLIICDNERVLACCAQAAARGVRAQIPLQRALAHCSDARIIPADRALYQKAWLEIEAVLEAHSPAIETKQLGLAYLDARDMGTLYGDEATWCEAINQEIQQTVCMQACIGVASARFAAWVAARSLHAACGHHLIAEQARAYLAPLPVSWLPLSEELRRRLAILGFQTLGQFAELKPATVAEQFGPDSLRFHQWARGEDVEPLVEQRRRAIHTQVTFEVPETDQSALLASISAAVQKSWDEKMRHILSVRRLHFRVRMFAGAVWEGSAWVGQTLGLQDLNRIVERLLAEMPKTGLGILELEITLSGLEPSMGSQLAVFAHTESRLRLEETLLGMARKHSPQCVAQARVKKALALVVKDRLALEEFRF